MLLYISYIEGMLMQNAYHTRILVCLKCITLCCLVINVHMLYPQSPVGLFEAEERITVSLVSDLA